MPGRLYIKEADAREADEKEIKFSCKTALVILGKPLYNAGLRGG
jgi:hypothetical protein